MDMNAFIEHSPELYDIAQEIAQAYRSEIQRVNAVAHGDLKNFKWDVEMTNNGIDLVFYLPDYWRYIEYGRGATGATPVLGQRRLKDILLEWINVKGINPTDISKETLAFLIARKIHTKGYAARHPLQNTLNMTQIQQNRFVEIVEDILLDDIKKETL